MLLRLVIILHLFGILQVFVYNQDLVSFSFYYICPPWQPQLPTPDQLKTVLDKVKDFFGDAKESFGKITALNTLEDSEESSTEKAK